MSTSIPVFTSPKGEKEIMHAYDAIMCKWAIPYKKMTIQTSFGETHHNRQRTRRCTRLFVLLHALLASAMSWYRNVNALSQSYRSLCCGCDR